MTRGDVQPEAVQAPAPHTVALTLESGVPITVAHRQDVDGEAIVIEAPQGVGGFHPNWAAHCATALTAGTEGVFRDDSDPLEPASVTVHPVCVSLTTYGDDVTLHVTPADRAALAEAIKAVAAAAPEVVA